MEGFVVGESVYASMSRIAEFSGKQGAYEEAKALLTGSWAVAPDDIDESAAGEYMICLVVSD